MGTQVTIIELMPNLLPGIDVEIAKIMEKVIKSSGITVHTEVWCGISTEASLQKIDHKKSRNIVTYTQGSKSNMISAEKVILTIGRKPDFSSLNIEKIGVKQKDGSIIVNEFMETNVSGIYAAGDVTGGIMQAHLAIAEGECAVRNAFDQKVAISYKSVPSCIYTTPEVAAVGLTEERAKETHEIIIGRFPLRGNGKALILNEIEGMVKIITDRNSGEVLGGHIISHHATDMISEIGLGMNLEATAEELAQTIHPHPTVSEAIMEAALTLSGGAIHIP